MSLLVVIVIGLFVGWLVAALLEFDEGMFAHMALGAAGAVIGSVVAYAMGRHHAGLFMVTWGSIAWSVLGALVVTGVAGIIVNPSRS